MEGGSKVPPLFCTRSFAVFSRGASAAGKGRTRCGAVAAMPGGRPCCCQKKAVPCMRTEEGQSWELPHRTFSPAPGLCVADPPASTIVRAAHLKGTVQNALHEQFERSTGCWHSYRLQTRTAAQPGLLRFHHSLYSQHTADDTACRELSCTVYTWMSHGNPTRTKHRIPKSKQKPNLHRLHPPSSSLLPNKAG
jgi:hypothetical protein